MSPKNNYKNLIFVQEFPNLLGNISFKSKRFHRNDEWIAYKNLTSLNTYTPLYYHDVENMLKNLELIEENHIQKIAVTERLLVRYGSIFDSRYTIIPVKASVYFKNGNVLRLVAKFQDSSINRQISNGVQSSSTVKQSIDNIKCI